MSRTGMDWRDWLLAVSLGAVWVVLQAALFWYGPSDPHDHGRVPFLFSPAAPGGYPAIRSLRPGEANAVLNPGDSVISVGDVDLRGATLAETTVTMNAARRSDQHQEIVYSRAGVVRSTPLRFENRAPPRWWTGAIYAVATALCAFLILLRGRNWHLRRRFFVGCLLSSISIASLWLSFLAGGRWGMAGFVMNVAATGPMAGVALWNAFEWTESARRRLATGHWPLLAAIASGAVIMVFGWCRAFTSVEVPEPWFLGFMSLWVLLMALAFSMSYRFSNALERRQIRWVLWGFGVTLLAFGSGWLLAALQLPIAYEILNLAPLAGVALPIGFLLSVLFEDYLDIDRVIPATTTVAVVLALLGVGAFTAIPALADQAALVAGFEARNVQLLLSMGLAALLVPGYQFINGRVEGWLNPQREELEHGFDRLLEELGRCRGVRELTRTAGEGIDGLLAPESIVTYAREGDAFTPVFARGRALPPAFDASTPLVSALQARSGPLVANRVRAAQSELSPFDRAALETLQVAVIGPTHWRGNLAAFQCLGPKKSGDIYTSTDLALLSAVGSKVGDLLARLDDEAVLHEAREMQSALRRYVPGQVADEITKGRELPEGERDVSVFFVDIRGYTSLSEGMQADEIFGTVNEHTELVSRIVTNHGGCVVEFGGDGMMAVFGAPSPLDDKEACAVAAAREVLVALGRTKISVGVGIATGPAFVGNITSADRHIWTVIGNTTNLAARLQSLTREMNAAVAIDAPTRDAAGSICRGFELHPDVRIRGRSESVDVYALPLPETHVEQPRLAVVSSK